MCCQVSLHLPLINTFMTTRGRLNTNANVWDLGSLHSPPGPSGLPYCSQFCRDCSLVRLWKSKSCNYLKIMSLCKYVLYIYKSKIPYISSPLNLSTISLELFLIPVHCIVILFLLYCTLVKMYCSLLENTICGSLVK